MKSNQCFLVSYIFKNQPQTIEVNADADSLTAEDVKPYIEAIHTEARDQISDIQVMGVHRQNDRHVHPGHYQQPEG